MVRVRVRKSGDLSLSLSLFLSLSSSLSLSLYHFLPPSLPLFHSLKIIVGLQAVTGQVVGQSFESSLTVVQGLHNLAQY